LWLKTKRARHRSSRPMPNRRRGITEDDRAILNAEKLSRPLWMEGERVKYSAKDILRAFRKEEEINFDLFDKDYLSVFEVFSPSY